MKLVIEKTVEFDVPPERVWQAITDPKEVAQWFPDRVEGDLKLGSRDSFVWDEHGSFEVEVMESERPSRFVWRWAGGDERTLQESSTLVEWTLEARDGGGTFLHLRESGFDNKKNFEENTGGWDKELGELIEYLN